MKAGGVSPVIRPVEIPIRSLDDARKAFRGRPKMELAQFWLPGPQALFAKGSVRLGLAGMSLGVFAELSDRDVFNPVERFNVPAFANGDVFELFVMPDGQEAYYEFHVTPGNHLLQLRFPRNARDLVRREEWDAVADPLLPYKISRWRIRSYAAPTKSGWQAYLEIPLKRVFENLVPWDGAGLRISCARYDHTRGRLAPVISSISPHAALNFHRSDEWDRFILEFK